MERNMETEKILTEEERIIINNLKEVCGEELAFEEQMKIEKGSTVARSAGPAVEAFRSFCKTDKELAEYVNSLTEKIKQKLENGEVKFEREAIKQMYEELSEDIKEAFENSAKNEVERQKESQDGEVSVTMEFPPENLFRDFFVELLEKQRKKQENEDILSVEEQGESKNEILKKAKKNGEEIKGGAQKIDDTLQEAGDSPEVVEVGKESGNIVKEGESAEGSLRKGVDEVITEENPKSENDKRREKWENETSDKKKKKDIEDYRLKLELKKGDLLAGKESIEDRIEELREETVKFAAKRAEAAMKVREQLSGTDTSKLEGFEQGEAKEAIEELAKNARNNLDDAKLRWLKEYLEGEEGNFSDLMDEHKNREITIENLEKMAGDLKKLEDYLIEFEGLSEDMQKEEREKAETLADKIVELAKDPKMRNIIIATGIALGVMGFFAAVGVPVTVELLRLASESGLIEEVAPYAIAGVGAVATIRYFLSDKERREMAGKLIGGGAGVFAGMGILGLSKFLDEKLWEDFIKGASKADYPDWYRFAKRFFNLGEDEKSKS